MVENVNLTTSPVNGLIPKGTYCSWLVSTETKKYYTITIKRNSLSDQVKIILSGDNDESYTMDS